MFSWIGYNKKEITFEREKRIAIEYILTSENVDFTVHENNQNQGAWGPEERIHFRSEVGVPECLRRIMTAGDRSNYGRINCKEFCEEIKEINLIITLLSGVLVAKIFVPTAL